MFSLGFILELWHSSSALARVSACDFSNPEALQLLNPPFLRIVPPPGVDDLVALTHNVFACFLRSPSKKAFYEPREDTNMVDSMASLVRSGEKSISETDSDSWSREKGKMQRADRNGTETLNAQVWWTSARCKTLSRKKCWSGHAHRQVVEWRQQTLGLATATPRPNNL